MVGCSITIFFFLICFCRDAVRESGNEMEAADAASPAPDRARLVLRVVVAALEKNFLHFAHRYKIHLCLRALICCLHVCRGCSWGDEKGYGKG